MTNKEVETFTKKELREMRFLRFPIMVAIFPILVPYTFIREVFEEGQTIRGWADELACTWLTNLEIIFTGKQTRWDYKGSLAVSTREKVRKLRKSGVSKTLCKAFIEHFGDWHTFSNKERKYICYHWSSDYSEEWVYLTYKDKDHYTFSYSDNEYSHKSKKLNCNYQLTEEQALAVLEAWSNNK